MKQIFFLILLTFIFSESIFSQSGWYWLNPYPTNQDIVSIQFLNENTGFAGAGNCIIKSTNGGLDWFTLPTDQMIKITSVHFIDFNTGFAGGYDTSITNRGRIIKTTNGGLSWILCPLIAFGPVTSVRFLNGATGFASGYYGCIYKTTNSGNNWIINRVDTFPLLSSIFISDANNIYVGGSNKIYKSQDGGNTWIVNFNSGNIGIINSVYFINPTTGYSLNSARFYRTTNSGENWLELGNGYGQLFHAVNSNIFYTVSSNLLRKTTDGGNTWFDVTSIGSSRTSLCFINEQKGFIGGYEGYFTSTSNGGNAWNNLHDGQNLDFYGIHFNNILTGFIACANGNLLKTTNSGVNWITINSGSNNTLLSVYSIDGINVWASGSEKLIKSTNSGINWLSMYPNSSGITFNNVIFVNKDTGFVTSSSNTFRTTDGGWDWNPQVTQINGKAIFFINSMTGYICGAYGKISKTTNCGASWVLQNSNVNTKLNSIYFANDNTGYAVGEYKTIIRTTNGGITWLGQSYSSSDFRLYSVFFTNPTTGYIAGYSIMGLSQILKTKDAGISWQSINAPLTLGHYVNVFFLDDNTGFFTGGNALIKTVSAGEPIGIKVIPSMEIPKQYSLLQNYPNPFNPTTKIRFSIPLSRGVSEGRGVSLVIYDLLGREIATLVNEELKPGTYEVNWNASDYPSGVYFYKLNTVEFSETKKMVLVK